MKSTPLLIAFLCLFLTSNVNAQCICEGFTQTVYEDSPNGGSYTHSFQCGGLYPVLSAGLTRHRAIRYRAIGTTDWTIVFDVSPNGIGGPFLMDIYDLEPCTAFEYQVTCEYRDQVLPFPNSFVRQFLLDEVAAGNLSQIKTFETGSRPSSRDVIENVIVSNPVSNILRLSWDPKPEAEEYLVRYRPVGGSRVEELVTTNSINIPITDFCTNYNIDIVAYTPCSTLAGGNARSSRWRLTQFVGDCAITLNPPQILAESADFSWYPVFSLPQEYDVYLYQDQTEVFSQTLTTDFVNLSALLPDTEYRLEIEPYCGSSTCAGLVTYTFRTTCNSNEPNENINEAVPIAVDQITKGGIKDREDKDVYSFTTGTNCNFYKISFIGDEADYTFFDENGAEVQTDFTVVGNDLINFLIAEPNTTYYVELSNYSSISCYEFVLEVCKECLTPLPQSYIFGPETFQMEATSANQAEYTIISDPYESLKWTLSGPASIANEMGTSVVLQFNAAGMVQLCAQLYDCDEQLIQEICIDISVFSCAVLSSIPPLDLQNLCTNDFEASCYTFTDPCLSSLLLSTNDPKLQFYSITGTDICLESIEFQSRVSTLTVTPVDIFGGLGSPVTWNIYIDQDEQCEFEGGPRAASESTQNKLPKLDQALVYPNPFRNELNLQLPESFVGQKLRYVIRDLTQRKLQERWISSKQITINLQHFDQGVYFISFWEEKAGLISTQKIVKLLTD